MEQSLKITSWIFIVIGVLSMFSGFGETSVEEAGYAFIGGLMFSGQGLLTLIYIKSK